MLTRPTPRLHKEIVDFYYHVKPRDFEDRVRGDLIERLNRTFQRRWKDSSIHAFGSYVAGLYLPTADMDLVMVSKSFIDGYPGIYDRKKHFFLVGDMVEREGIAVPGTVQVIHKARVPLVKFVDRRTGLQVDISFENDSGLIANSTFKEWKERYPAMPILVTLVKQFLAMRGLNEPANGGIGGLSVTCLVVSLLQLMPQVQSGNMVPEHHLGEILMEFLDLYGRQFNVSTTAISLRPPGYVPKVSSPTPPASGGPCYLGCVRIWHARATNNARLTDVPCETEPSPANPLPRQAPEVLHPRSQQ
jgi:non-canonical poly(A) RNA polymerase PAPD5/7